MLRWVAASFCLDKVLLVNVLLVTPFHDLPLLPAETEMLVNLLKPRRVLQDDVSEKRLRDTIQDEVRNGGQFDGLWLATHMSERSVQLTDGPISGETLVQYVALSGADWCVLNGCESEGLAGAIAASGVDVVSVALTEGGTGIGDKDALRMGALLAQKLEADDGDLEAAFSSIPNAGTHYRFFPAGATVARTYNNDRDLGMTLARLEEKVDGLTREVAEIKQAMKERPTAAQVVGYVFVSSVVILAIVGFFFYLLLKGWL